MGKLTLRNPAHVMPSVWTEDGEECVSDRVFNGWGPKIVRAVNAHDDLLAACKLMLEHFAPGAVDCAEWALSGNSQTDAILRATRAAIARAEAAQ